MKEDYKLAEDVSLEWFDCTTSFSCPCGKGFYMDADDNELAQCKCGRTYRFSCKLEVKSEDAQRVA